MYDETRINNKTSNRLAHIPPDFLIGKCISSLALRLLNVRNAFEKGRHLANYQQPLRTYHDMA